MSFLLDSDYDPTKDTLYQSFTQYFENPFLTKIKDVNGYSMYAVKIQADLGIEFMYLIVFTPLDWHHVGDAMRMNELRWVSLQTRKLNEEIKDTKEHFYFPKRIPPFNSRITLVKSDAVSYEYTCETLPIKITLLSPSAKRTTVYTSSGTLATAIQTYQTIITLI
jgi:hypothetical protein